MILDDFSNWMNKNTKLSDSSVYKYKRAINTISNEMKDNNVINKSFFDMNLTELDFAIFNVLNNPIFIEKNTTGNNMYSNALKRYRMFAIDCIDNDYDAEIKIANDIAQNHNISVTEKERIIKARVGQGTYRDDLMKKYDSKCVVTGIDNKKLLIASHIKPWSICDNAERVDVNNGLLLSANMDRLFDSGLITFENDGHIWISSFLGKANEQRLNIDESIYIDLKATSDMLQYLEYHRDVLYVK